MKIALILLAGFSSALLFWFCKHTKYAVDQLPAEQIRFGRGGGVTGKETTYTLLQNGQIFQKGMDGQTAEIDDTKARTAKSIFKSVEKLQLGQLAFQHPGNTYSFIEVPAGTATNRISWGDNNYPIDPAVQDLFLKMMELAAPQK